jgi:lipoprotein-anchoring transpeptidase ErfK/SrfK
MSVRAPGPPWKTVASAAPPGGARAELAPEIRARRRARARRRGLVLLLLAVAALAIVATTSSAVVSGAARPAPAPAAGTALRTDVPTAPGSALAVPSPHAMPTPAAHTAAWAPVRRRTVARRVPRGHRVALVGLRTPEGTTNLLEVIGRRRDAHGRLWAHVRLAVLPNDTTAWVPRSTLGGITTVRTHLYVNLGTRTATLMRGDQMVLRAPVGVGRPGAATPAGRFYVRNRLTTYRSKAYGPVAFGTSARSVDLTDWPAGGYIGIHGTDRPDLVPGRVSHGCIRMRNADIRRLARLMPIGTPVTVA